jgi:hypothetical protein
MLATAPSAFAEPSAADKETARSLMTEGRAARDKGDLQAAMKAFVAADAIMHVPTTGLEVARAQVALGQLVEARDTALRVTRIPERAGEPAPFKQARQAAAALNDDLESRIPSVIVHLKDVPDGATATVTIDEAPVPLEVIGQPRKLDPGRHNIVAKAGMAEGRQEVDLAERDAKDVTVELLSPEGATPATTEAAGGSQPTEEPPAERSTASKVMIWGGFGVAGAGLVVGSITGMLTLSKTNSIKSNCNGNNCPSSQYGDMDSAGSLGTISTVSFVAAGAGLAVGIVGLLIGPSTPAPTPTAPAQPAENEKNARIEPWIGVGAVGLRGRF